MTYRVAIIGAGGIAGKHLEAIGLAEKLVPCSIADIDRRRADELAALYGIRAYADYKEMIERERPDIAVVTLPHFLHKEASLFSAARGCHVLLEKPMALDSAECDEIAAFVRASRVKLMVGHTQHYIAETLAAKEWIESGRLGRLVLLNDRRHQRYDVPGRPGWFFEKAKAGGGILTNLGSHSIDKIQWLTNSRVTKVKAVLDYDSPIGDVEGGGTAFLETSAGIPATISQSGYLGAVVDETELRFTGGSLLLRTGAGLWVSDGGAYREAPVPPRANPFLRQFEDLLEAMEEDREPACSMAYSRSVVAAVESLYRSHETGTEVSVHGREGF
ncbi:Gfo/Idh/MocA family protein [Cohnella zeiphila]|uniref:Gfo/Idh/MocA family oxidoreductase n=1 Tax=Cohnella zeiphila TaxID=2761120 RepID=A0A7X0SH90_9BACL|nr:Gfo/Idh/MocA family oxidoreductase [Cohnella zeiphila]MBB6729928.1 Gfo/Idh/MocA family oxidoreductase [Cohnella zeiphila]